MIIVIREHKPVARRGGSSDRNRYTYGAIIWKIRGGRGRLRQ